MSRLGMFLLSLRQQRHVSRSVLANQAQVSYGTLRNWELGLYLPRLPELMQLLNAMETPEGLRSQALELLQRPRAVEALRTAPTESSVLFPPLPLSQGDLMRAMRLRRGVPLKNIAEYIGVAVRTVSRWERGQSQPAPEQQQALCLALSAAPAEIALLVRAHPSDERREDLISLQETFWSLWEGPFPPEKTALLELSYLSLALRLRPMVWDNPGVKALLLQTYAALANHYYLNHQYAQATTFAGQTISLFDPQVPMTNFGVIALARFAQTSHNLRLATDVLIQWYPYADAQDWQAWLLSILAPLLVRQREHERAEGYSRRSLKMVEHADWNERQGRALDRCRFLQGANRYHEAKAMLPPLVPPYLSHITLAWARQMKAEGDMEYCCFLSDLALKRLDEDRDTWAHVIPFLQRPLMRLLSEVREPSSKAIW